MAISPAIVDTFVAPPCAEAIRILYQDEDLLLLDKPSGLLSLSGKNPLNRDSVHYRLVSGQLQGLTAAAMANQPIQPYPTAALVHRLDFGTSGIMVAALNPRATASLSKQFQARTVVKVYLAMVEGQLATDQGVIDLPIAKDDANFPLLKVCLATGKPARSEYQVVARWHNPERCLVRYLPTTGRTHQLRIHSLALGHPILGCDLYKNDVSEALAKRLLLHASELHFDHPTTGQRIIAQSPCPF